MAYGRVTTYTPVTIGRSPDRVWTFYAVWERDPHMNFLGVIGIVAESAEFEHWSGNPYRLYKTLSYEPGNDYGTMSMSSARSLDDAVEWMSVRHDRSRAQKEENQVRFG